MRHGLPCAPGCARPHGSWVRHIDTMGQMDLPDLGQQGAIGRFARAFGPAAPSIIARRRDAHHIAHDANRKRLALFLDETEFHFGASEKMRSVFFRSPSMRRRSFSRRKRSFSATKSAPASGIAACVGTPRRSRLPLAGRVAPSPQPCNCNSQLLINLSQRPPLLASSPKASRLNSSVY